MLWGLLVLAALGGVIAGLLLARRRRKTTHTQTEDALKHLFDCAYHHRQATLTSVAGTLAITQDAAARLLGEMEQAGLVEAHTDGWSLTATGQAEAARVVRAHRLWERHLADRTGYAASEWHRQSERREHAMTPADADALAAALEYPRFDPHGDPIPTSDGKMPPAGPPLMLSRMPPGRRARVTHLEDEPTVLYEELLDHGIYVGMPVDTVTRADGRVHLCSGDATIDLSAAAAGNVTVMLETAVAGSSEAAEEADLPADMQRLSVLKPGEVGRVVEISPRCVGAARRRFLDLGILPGTLIRAEMVSPGGDPTAYRIRGALIGLRHEQADMIGITRVATMDQADALKLGVI